MKIFFTIICSFLLIGCPNKDDSDFTSISLGKLYGAGEEGFKKENIIISSNKEWNSFLKKANSINKISDDFSEAINFDKYQIIAVIDKVRSSGGFSIKVDEIINKKEKLVIKISNQSPNKNEDVTSSLEQPYHLIMIKKTEKPIQFVAL